MKSTNNILEFAIETPRDGNLYVPFSGLTLRGRKDLTRIARHKSPAATLISDYPRGIPGKVVKVDVESGRVWVVEPLQSEEYEPEREKLVQAGFDIEKTYEVHPTNHVAWLYAMKRAVLNKCATLVKGDMPEDLGPDPTLPAEEPDKSEDRIDRLCNLVETLLGKLVAAK